MLAAGYSLFFYVFGQRTAPSVMTTELMRDFDVTAASLSNLSAFYFWSYVVVQIPVGLAVDRWGPRRVLAPGLLTHRENGWLLELCRK